MCIGHTPLTFAVDENQPEIVKLLLEANADINIAAEYGITSFMWANSLTDIEPLKSAYRMNTPNYKDDIPLLFEYYFEDYNHKKSSDENREKTNMIIDLLTKNKVM